MNKADLIDRLELRLGSRRAAADAVETIVDIIIREVTAGGSVGITGFGTFERADRAPRTGRNPRTGETVRIASTAVPKFRPGTQFKELVADPSRLPAEGLAGGRAPASRSRSGAGPSTAGGRASSRAGREAPRAGARRPASSQAG